MVANTKQSIRAVVMLVLIVILIMGITVTVLRDLPEHNAETYEVVHKLVLAKNDLPKTSRNTVTASYIRCHLPYLKFFLEPILRLTGTTGKKPHCCAYCNAECRAKCGHAHRR